MDRLDFKVYILYFLATLNLKYFDDTFWLSFKIFWQVKG